MDKVKRKSVQFTASIERFNEKGEKTGWTYILIPPLIAETLFPGNRKSFRVKGKLDNHSIKCIAAIPIGKGSFILPFNAALRKATGKSKGDTLIAKLEVDTSEIILNKEMLECIKEEPLAYEYFCQLTRSHQNYFSKWVDSAKTFDTKANRIARVVNALVRKMNYAEMLRAGK